jgi:hypothetical protein
MPLSIGVPNIPNITMPEGPRTGAFFEITVLKAKGLHYFKNGPARGRVFFFFSIL